MGAAALTRNEALWVAVVWAWLAIRRSGSPLAERLRLIGVVAVVSLLVFAPWAARDWVVFGNPLPGQAISNALSVTGFDIFAWNDPPTLSRYLAVGPARLVEMRVEGLAHNVFNVLVFLGIPLSVIGILALPWQARGPCAAAGGADQRDRLPGDEPAVPGRHHLGHLPPRRGARPRADHRRRRWARWTPDLPAWAGAWAGPGRSRGWARCWPWAAQRCSPLRWCPSSRRRRGIPRVPTMSSPARWRRSARPRTARTR